MTTPEPQMTRVPFVCAQCQAPVESYVNLADPERLQQCRCGEWRDLSERLDDMRLEQAQAQGRGM